MERKLRALFDYQKFEQNKDLQNVIDRVHARYRSSSRARMLDDDEADMVAAAGLPDTAMKKKSLLKDEDEHS